MVHGSFKCTVPLDILGFPSDSVVKNPPAIAGDTGDVGSIPGLGRFPGEMATHSSILAWKIQCIEEPVSLKSVR